jgi:predicted ATPase/DNA-binding XRE family transcriptional regulator
MQHERPDVVSGGRVTRATRGRVPTFAELLSRHRASAGLTQEELASRAGLSANAVGLLERGQRTAPRVSTVAVLARALGLTRTEHEAFLAAARRRREVPRPALAVPPELRLPTMEMVGREQEMARARVLLAGSRVRLLTLIGPPGSGKTRLALELATELADDYRDGVVLLALGPLRDSGLVIPALRHALGLRDDGRLPALEMVAMHCKDLELLLVLDNFEHVLDAVPDLVELLAHCPRLQALVTSRAALRVRVEHKLPVPPLALPKAMQERRGAPVALAGVASVRLFVERAETAVPGFQLNEENAGPVAAICRRLDGLPLALELAAPCLALLTPQEMLDRLDHHLELPLEGPRDMPERQRTMRAALSWSCDLLAPAARALLRRLSVFAGGASIDAIEGVCQAAGPLPGGTIRNLAELVDHSLVQQRVTSKPSSRVTLLESVREYACQLLAAAGELETTSDAHLQYFLKVAVEGRAQSRTAAQGTWLELLDLEHDNVRAALQWATEDQRREDGLHLAAALWWFWDNRGHRQEGLMWLERLLAISAPVSAAVRAEALHVAGMLAFQVGSAELSSMRLRESLTIFQELDDRRGVAEALRGIATTLSAQGQLEESVALLEGAVGVLRGMDDPGLLAAALMNLGVCVSRLGEDMRASDLYTEALALKRLVGDELGAAFCLANLGSRARESGNLDAARECLLQAEAIARRHNAPHHLAISLANLGDVMRDRSELAVAARHYSESLEHFTAIGYPEGIAYCLTWLAWLWWKRGDPVASARLFGCAAEQTSTVPELAAVDATRLEMARTAVREILGDSAYALNWEEGRRLSAQEAAVMGAGEEARPARPI